LNNSLKNASMLKSFTLFGTWFISFFPVSREMLNEWIGHSNNSHGMLVPLVSLYFVWQKKDGLRSVPLSSSSWGGFLLGGSLLLYVISYAGEVAFATRLMMVISLMGMILFNYGRECFRKIVFPLFFLFFMIPIPTSLIQPVTLPLQFIATSISASIIRLFSIPVLQEGNMLYFVQTQLEVAEACSGLHSIMALTMLSVIFAYLTDKGLLSKITLIASAIPLAFLANIIRVSGTGILAHYFGEKIARGFLHEFSGMAVFIFGFTILFLEYLLITKYSGQKKYA